MIPCAKSIDQLRHICKASILSLEVEVNIPSLMDDHDFEA